MTATATPLSPEICAQMRLAHLNMIQAQMRLAHLNMIQGIIGRVSWFSATIKNFTVTICAGVTALSFQ